MTNRQPPGSMGVMHAVEEPAQRPEPAEREPDPRTAPVSPPETTPAAPPAPTGPQVPALLAAGFLTAVPVPLRGLASARQLAAALCYFPLIGALLGVVVAVLDRVFLLVFPTAIASVLDLVVLTLLTGGIHLDALMDTCDGVFGGRTPERRLEIMRDSRVGSFGVTGGILVVLLQFAALSQLAPAIRPAALVAVLALSRWSMVLAILAFPPARPEGLGASFRARARLRHVIVATLLAALALLPLGLRALAVGLTGLGVAVLAGRFIRAQVGGLTGDSYGAIGEVVTAVGLVALAASWPW